MTTTNEKKNSTYACNYKQYNKIKKQSENKCFKGTTLLHFKTN